jgi:putative aminopeptidase FrvX
VDEHGNVRVTVGQGGKPIVFVAHMDEVGFDITRINPDGTAALRTRGGMYASLWEAHPVLVQTSRGPLAAVIAPRQGYTTAKEAQPDRDALFVYFGTRSEAESLALGVAPGQTLTIRKRFMRLGPNRATGRAMDDRVGSTALVHALRQIDPKTLSNEVTFAWSVEEETGLTGAAFLASMMDVDTAFAVDTFVSTDTPVDIQRLAGAKLGKGAVLRVLDSRTIVPPHIVDRITAIAKTAKIPLQLGTTSGGTDASAFSAGGAIDVGLSWPGRYSHSPVEVMDRRDLDALVRLIVAVAKGY